MCQEQREEALRSLLSLPWGRVVVKEAEREGGRHVWKGRQVQSIMRKQFRYWIMLNPQEAQHMASPSDLPYRPTEATSDG